MSVVWDMQIRSNGCEKYWGELRYPILEHFHPHPLFGPLLMLIIPPISTYNHKTIGQYEIIVSEKLL